MTPNVLLLDRVEQARCIGSENSGDLVSHAAKDGHFFCFTADGLRWVVEIPMITMHLTGKNRACLFCISANGDHGANLVAEEFVQVLRVMLADVDADLRHDLDRKRMHVAGRI